MQTQTYSLYHLQTRNLITFRPVEDGHLKGMVSVTMTCGANNYSCMTLTREEARELWTAWRKVGAHDLRKHALIDGRVYKREADGTLSYTIIVNRYDHKDYSGEYQPKGHAFAHASYPPRDADLDHDDNVVAYHYKPEGKHPAPEAKDSLRRTPDGCLDHTFYANFWNRLG